MYRARGGWNIKGRELKFCLVNPDIKCSGEKVSANSDSNFLDFWPPLGEIRFELSGFTTDTETAEFPESNYLHWDRKKMKIEFELKV